MQVLDTEIGELLRDALATIDAQAEQIDAYERARSEPIAIVGVGCRLPGGDTVEAFHAAGLRPSDRARPIPPSRWNVEDWDFAGPGTRQAILLDEAARSLAELAGLLLAMPGERHVAGALEAGAELHLALGAKAEAAVWLDHGAAVRARLGVQATWERAALARLREACGVPAAAVPAEGWRERLAALAEGVYRQMSASET